MAKKKQALAIACPVCNVELTLVGHPTEEGMLAAYHNCKGPMAMVIKMPGVVPAQIEFVLEGDEDG